MSGGSLVGAMATYSCDTSFRLIGMESRQCQENRTWSGEPPTCEGNHNTSVSDYMHL